MEDFSLGKNSFNLLWQSELKMSQMASASPGGIGPSLPGEIINRKLIIFYVV